MRLLLQRTATPKSCRKWKRCCRAPKSPYAVQKLAGEYYASVFHSCFDLETVALRFFNVFGERQDPSSPYSGVLSLFFKALIERRSPTIFGDGEQTRDFTYVEDVAALCLKAASAPGVAGKMYNAGNGNRYSLNAVWDLLQKIEGRELATELRSGSGGRRARFPSRHHRCATRTGATRPNTRWSKACGGLWSGLNRSGFVHARPDPRRHSQNPQRQSIHVWRRGSSGGVSRPRTPGGLGAARCTRAALASRGRSGREDFADRRKWARTTAAFGIGRRRVPWKARLDGKARASFPG